MPSSVTTEESPTASVASVAKALSAGRRKYGAGRAAGYCVRLSDTITGLLEAAKPADQSMVHFLREAAVTIALQRLEASQK
jgi:hypothetical protein